MSWSTVKALKSGNARPLSLAAGDSKEDGTQDLAGGYAGPSGGIVSLYIGNREGLSAVRFPGYLFTHCGPNGFTLSGTGMVSFVNGIRMLTDKKPERNISPGFNTAQLTGSATVSVIPATGLITTYRITDTNPHATCNCGPNS